MLEKILEFFRSLFSGLSGGSKKPNPQPVDPPVKPKPEETLPPPEPTFPQDAAELDRDTASNVVVHEVDEPVILQPGDDPAEPIIAAPTPITEPEVEPVTEPEVVETEVITTPQHVPRYRWCLDNGHGKKTAGKRSPKFEDGSQFFEYEFNRDIVKRVIDQLEIIGVKYFNVVPEVDIDDFLAGRVGRANRLKSDLPKIFLSIHANAFGRSGWQPPSGIETWHFHTSRTGRALARIFQKHLVDKLKWKNRKLKSYPGPKQFYVLRNTSMSAVLTENGFYTNKEECRLLMKDSVRQKIADAHVEAILEIEKNGL